MSSSEKYRQILENAANRDDDPGTKKAPARSRSFLERQLEWLTLGLTVVLFGVALLLQSDVALEVVFPLTAGGIILISAILQKIGRNWNVSIFTWIIGVLLLAFGITETLSRVPSNEDFAYATYFAGSVIVLGGVVIMLQILRRR